MLYWQEELFRAEISSFAIPLDLIDNQSKTLRDVREANGGIKVSTICLLKI